MRSYFDRRPGLSQTQIIFQPHHIMFKNHITFAGNRKMNSKSSKFSGDKSQFS